MSSPTQMGQIYLIFNQLTFLWDTSEIDYMIKGEYPRPLFDFVFVYLSTTEGVIKFYYSLNFVESFLC